MSILRAQTSDELETVEAQNSLFELLYDGSARAVTTRVGQFVYRRVDSVLSIVEKTARWSLPQVTLVTANDDPNKINITAPPLIRPLPWLLFLPALIALRLIRATLSFLALMLGQPPVDPVTMVGFLQNKRRKLRALKYHGQRLNRIIRVESLMDEPRPTWLDRVALPFRGVISTKKPALLRANHNPCEKHTAKKHSTEERDVEDSDDSVEGAVCAELLKKYANVDEDSSFNEISNGHIKSATDHEDHLESHEPPRPPPPDRCNLSLAVALKAQISLGASNSFLFSGSVVQPIPMFTSNLYGRYFCHSTSKFAKSTNDIEEAFSESSDSSISEKSTSEAETTLDAPEAIFHENGMNGHGESDKPKVASAQPADSTKEPEKPQEKASLNISKEPVPILSPSIERAVEAIAENGSSESVVASEPKQDSKSKTTAVPPPAKTTVAAVAPEVVAPNPKSLTNTNTNSSNKSKVPSVPSGEMRDSTQQRMLQNIENKIKQLNPQPAPLQPQNHQSAITANGGSGGTRKQKRPNQNHS
ncbi:uncharacterized protein LOC128737280 isoform X1 [Sabethes cyaneus]|uniref:uncharacterized protein LOC128737280 isoform X1 n=1 Tax=Sabethes cyaneus TaxID=53552 RepID=UPI00237E4A38|nr:uncharacterized protein LOC128737280 isoform X1 [Sabethes cyaneus]